MRIPTKLNGGAHVSLREASLAAALILSIGAGLVLSYELVQIFLKSPDGGAVVVSEATGSADTTNKNLLFSFPDRPESLPDIKFVDADDQPHSLSDFRGRPILLNLWATWCVPCQKEMPSLDRLQAKFDPSKFLILTLSIDRQGIPAVKKFYGELKLKSLGIYVDQSGIALQLLRAPGLPTTLLINRTLQEVGRKIGQATWDSPELRPQRWLPSAYLAKRRARIGALPGGDYVSDMASARVDDCPATVAARGPALSDGRRGLAEFYHEQRRDGVALALGTAKS